VIAARALSADIDHYVRDGAGRFAMRHDHDRALAATPRQRREDARLGRGIERAGRLVEEQHGCIAREGARDREEPALATRERPIRRTEPRLT